MLRRYTLKMTDQAQSSFSFEEAYARLERILEELNSGETPLERSLALYEEANKLISVCSSKLNHAEQKIEMLIRSREGKPETAPFTPDNQQVFENPHDRVS